MRSVAPLLLLLALVTAGACRRSEPLPMLYEVPDVSLISESSEPLSLSSLRGNVVIYDFIFTSCTSICPMMTERMKRLADELPARNDLRFISVTVDPENDTPEVLTRYANAVRKDTRWQFLTGERDEIFALSVTGFKLAAGPGGSADEPIIHSPRFVLVDRSGVVRGYYDSLDDDSMKSLRRDARRLLAGK
jgi:protein SCO1